MTNEQLKAVLQMGMAIGDAIRDLGEVPSGHLYAQLMGKLSLANYEAILRGLARQGLIRVDGSHLITWTGPAKAVKA